MIWRKERKSTLPRFFVKAKSKGPQRYGKTHGRFLALVAMAWMMSLFALKRSSSTFEIPWKNWKVRIESHPSWWAGLVKKVQVLWSVSWLSKLLYSSFSLEPSHVIHTWSLFHPYYVYQHRHHTLHYSYASPYIQFLIWLFCTYTPVSTALAI